MQLPGAFQAGSAWARVEGSIGPSVWLQQLADWAAAPGPSLKVDFSAAVIDGPLSLGRGCPSTPPAYREITMAGCCEIGPRLPSSLTAILKYLLAL